MLSCWFLVKMCKSVFLPLQAIASLVNKIEWNKFHFANLLAFKMNTNLTSEYTSIFSCWWKSHCMFFFLTRCIFLTRSECIQFSYIRLSWTQNAQLSKFVISGDFPHAVASYSPCKSVLNITIIGDIFILNF